MARTISDFRASFETNPAQPSRFDVEIPIPIGLVPYLNISSRLNMRCEATELPGRSIATTTMKIYGPEEKYPYQTTYNDIALTFIVSDDMKEKLFFDAWLEWINPSLTYNFKYKGDYAVPLRINQYDAHNEINYSVDLLDAFPSAINPLEVAWSSDGYHKLTVVFSYTSWKNNSLEALAMQFVEAGIGYAVDALGGTLGNASTAGIGYAVSPVLDKTKGVVNTMLGKNIPTK